MSQQGTEASLWAATAAQRFEGQTLSHDIDCDVSIIGAGFTGIRTALELASNGLRVAVFDAGGVGWGASGRNGGQVNPMLPVARPDDLLKAVGPIYFERLAQTSLGSADALFDLIRKYQIKCDARQHGWLRVDHSAKARKTWREAAKAWSAHGMEYDLLDGDDARKASGSPAYDSAILNPRGGAVQPLSLVCGLAHAAHSAGAAIYEKARIETLERTDKGWALTCGGHRISSEWVVLATNGYTDRLRPDVQKTVLPINPIQIGSGPLPEDLIKEILPAGQTISDTRRVIMYARREPGNQIVYGGCGFKGLNGEIGGFEWLKKDAVRVFPQLRDVKWEYQWGGQIAVTPDHVPTFMEPAPGLISGMGYNGRGVAMSHAMGKVLADRVLGTPAADLPFPVSTRKNVAFKAVQELGSGVVIRMMRVMDALESR